MLLLQNYTFYLLILWVTVTQAYLPQRYTSINRVTKHQAIVARTSVEEGIPVPIGELVRPPSVREEIVIRPAKFHDLASIVKLRISVFYPSVSSEFFSLANL